MNDHLATAVRNLFHSDPVQRPDAAAVIRDLSVDLATLLPAVAGALVLSGLIEPDEDPYEQMLNTLGDLSVLSEIPLSVLAPLREIEPTEPWEVEYVDDILENAGYHAEPPPLAHCLIHAGRACRRGRIDCISTGQA